MNEALKEVRDLLATSMSGRGIAAFYAGDIGTPAKGNLPCIIVREVSTRAGRQSTSSDQYIFGISVLLITDIFASADVAGIQNNTVASRERLRVLMEEGDTTGAPKTDTVLGTFMKQANIRGSNFVYNLNGRIDYRPPAPHGFTLAAAELTLDVITDFVKRTA